MMILLSAEWFGGVACPFSAILVFFGEPARVGWSFMW